MMTPSAIEEFLPATVDVGRDFVQMVGEKLEMGKLDSDFLDELKKYFLEVGRSRIRFHTTIYLDTSSSGNRSLLVRQASGRYHCGT